MEASEVKAALFSCPTWDARGFVACIVLLGFVLEGIAVALQEGPLAPLICPAPGAPVGLKLAAWVDGVEVASTTA